MDKRSDDAPVEIVPYDSSWPALFEHEKKLLEDAIGPWITGGVHHVGSTAVPGLAAKPVIDILVGVDDLGRSRRCFDRLAQLGYLYAPYRSDEMHWFCKPSPEHRTHHLHLVPTGSPRFRAELAFRDMLRKRPDLADRYAQLKMTLAIEHRDDREAYTRAKQGFIADVLGLAAHADEADQFAHRVVTWAAAEPDTLAVAIIGSWARNTADTDSDLDIILLTNNQERYTRRDDWLAAFGSPPVVRRRHFGIVTERRVRLPSALEVEFGIAPKSWASTKPIDPGTLRIVADGLRPLVDPDGLLKHLLAAARAADTAPKH